LVLNFWTIGAVFPDPKAIRVTGGVETLKAQINAVMTGPIGTQGHWSRLTHVPGGSRDFVDLQTFTLAHEADETITIQGKSYNTMRLHLTGTGYAGLLDVQHWYDRASLLILKRVAPREARGTFDVVAIEPSE
jgi:hypothetical protein